MLDVLKGLKLFEKDFRLRSKIAMLMEEWKRACPSVNIKDQIGWAHYWLQSKVAVNPVNMKKDLIKFLSNWMKNEEKRNQERRQGERRAPGKYVEEKPAEDDVMSGEDWAKLRNAIRK